MAPSVSVLTGFDCLDFQDLAGGGEGGGISAHNSRALSLLTSFLRAWTRPSPSLNCVTLPGFIY